ncbi:MAG: hypothetical protein KJ077_29610 [Anaerolineae bacterium]|nr:hypothetical protein [Anaerolineae bacterium]
MSAQKKPPLKLTHAQLAQARVIAKGKRIKDIRRLLDEYGGTVGNWVKKSSQPLIIENRLAEIHWYEHQGIGRVEEKIKWLDYES